MSHKSLQELRTQLHNAKSQVRTGEKYYHYKDPRKHYQVTGLSILEATDEIAVKYALVDDPDIEFVRPLNVWLEHVEWHGQAVARFTRVI